MFLQYKKIRATKYRKEYKYTPSLTGSNYCYIGVISTTNHKNEDRFPTIL
jgi:hypothetical protein